MKTSAGEGAMTAQSLPYRADSTALFQAVAGEPWAVFLDSGHPQAGIDVLAARPYRTLVTRGGITEVTDAQGTRQVEGDPLDLLRRHMPAASQPGPPGFSGGAIGYFAYDLDLGARRAGRRDGVLPDMAVGLYDCAMIVDHARRETRLIAGTAQPHAADRAQALAGLFATAGTDRARRADFRVAEPPRSNFTLASYRRAFGRILDYIRAGDCYQVNLAQHFSAPATGDPWSAYLGLRRLNPAPYAAYLNYPFGQILSCSPESFLRVRGRSVETRPIKGTRPRDPDPARDAELARELQCSAKDRAENLMIVDLLRNDLGKVCAPGSVAVPELFKLESYARVHHLVSCVTGRLAAGHDAIDLLRAAFPGGSITGAPKLRAMEIISELEPAPRSVYCGAIGWLSGNGDMDLNIAIRTAAIAQGRLHYWAGGGIVADSRAEEEYRECLDKAAAFLQFAAACR